MSAVVAVTVMHVLLFVLHVCVCCEGDGNAGVGSGGGVVACMSGTRGSGVLSSTGLYQGRERWGGVMSV